MNNVIELDPSERSRVSASTVVGSTTSSGISGGGGGDGMEARIAKLESDVTHISSRIDEIGKDVRELRSGHNRLIWGGVAACAFLLLVIWRGYAGLSTRSENISDKVSSSETTLQKQISNTQNELQRELARVQVTLQRVSDAIDHKKQ